jgi:spoIIIJ-associated protein
VDVEVLDAGSRGLLGLGGRQARIRLTIKQAESTEPETEQPEPAEAVSEADGQELRLAEETVRELIGKMKVKASVSAHYGEPDEDDKRPIHVDIHGNDLGILIGRRAEILNSLQYIVNLILGKQLEKWVQVVVDVEGYRSRRERQLRQMARRMADQAMKTGRRQVLEPMSAAERRIIHLELRDHSNVTTQSVGDEPGRKVTIVPK